MDFVHPIEAIIPGVQGKVLAVLAETTADLNMRTIARLADVSAAQASRVLPDLVELGLVERGDLGLALERQIKNIVRELLVWTEGSYAFEPTAEPDPDPTFGGVELDALLEDLQRA